MTKQWRPENFDELKAEIFGHVSTHSVHEDYLLEAGFDLCLEALEPLIMRIAPASKLVEIIYKEEE